MPDVVDRLISAMNRHDLDGVMECYTPAAVGVTPEFEAENLEEIASYYLHLWQGFPNMRLTVWEKVASGDLVVTEMLATGSHNGPFLVAGGEVIEGTGRNVSVRLSWLFNVENDRVVSYRLYFDQLELYAQIGARLPLKFAPVG
jgi:predicted ester cyclase